MISADYVYFISSLPTLQFGSKGPFSFEKFLELCGQYLPEKDVEIFKRSSISGDYDEKENQTPALKRWRDFDTMLRNELVKIRASRKHLDPVNYMRQDGAADSSIAHIAMNAHRNPSILEAERMLDMARWDALDELEMGHYFDLDLMIVYAHKLLILERWETVETAQKESLLEKVLR